MFNIYLVISGLSNSLGSAGGYKGDKDGYPVPAGTDIFLSVSSSYICLIYLF